MRALSQAFALAVPHPEAIRIRDDVAFFQAVRAALSKRAATEGKTDEELDHAVRQIVSRAVAPEGVLDIFAAAGLDKPDVSILSDEFLAEVRDMRQRNLAVELLQKLLKGELATRRRKNVVLARSFAELLEQTIRRYQNRAVEAAQVIEELIGLARDMRTASARGETLGLSDDELAFYDALGVNDSAVQVLGDDTLRDIARELVENRTKQRDHRLDAARERPCQSAPPREARPAQARLPARQAGVGDADGAGAGRGPLRRLGSVSASMATTNISERGCKSSAHAGMRGSIAGSAASGPVRRVHRASDRGEAALIRERLARLGDEKAALEARLAEVEAAGPEEQKGPQPKGPVTNRSAAREKIALFRSLFRGREDVFPQRWENVRTGKAGYAPACGNEWMPGLCDKPRIKCGVCSNQAFLAVTEEVDRRASEGTPHGWRLSHTSRRYLPVSRRRLRQADMAAGCRSLSRSLPGRSGFRRPWNGRVRAMARMSGSSSQNRCRLPLRAVWAPIS